MRPVVTQLSDAVDFGHRHDVVHRDLKPENVLVKAIDPLDLVIADWGIARAMDTSVQLTASTQGTWAYMPPEALLRGEQEITTSWDWWSVGMILAEFASGRHPLSSPYGGEANEEQVRSELMRRAVDLSGIDDPSVRLLCSGLLHRDRRERWGFDQVEAWLQGNPPELVVESVNGVGHSVWFGGSDYHALKDLAVVLRDNWSRALISLFQERDQVLIEELQILADEEGNSQVLSIVGRNTSPGKVVPSFVRLLAEMNSQLEPVFDGTTVTPDGLEALALQVVNHGPDERDADRLKSLREHDVLRIWRRLSGMRTGPTISEQWNKNAKQINSTVGHILGTDTRAITDAWGLLLALDEGFGDDLADRLSALDSKDASSQKWWRTLSQSNSAVDHAAALATYDTACAETSTARERERQDEAARAAEDAQRQQAKEAADFQARCQSTAERARRWRYPVWAATLWALVSAVSLGAVAVQHENAISFVEAAATGQEVRASEDPINRAFLSLYDAWPTATGEPLEDFSVQQVLAPEASFNEALFYLLAALSGLVAIAGVVTAIQLRRVRRQMDNEQAKRSDALPAALPYVLSGGGALALLYGPWFVLFYGMLVFIGVTIAIAIRIILLAFWLIAIFSE